MTNVPNLTKQSDKVLAKFARRAATMRQVCVAADPTLAGALDEVVHAVKAELAARNVKWDSSASE